MLSALTSHRLSWDDEDMRAMAKVLGPESASKQSAPRQDSIIRAAAKRGVLLDRELRVQLNAAIRLRNELRPIRVADDVPAPTRLWRKLFPHQRVALKYMDRLPAYLLADQPGVGKTAVAILWAVSKLNELYTQSSESTRALIVTPNSAKDQWKRELKRWAGDSAWRISIVDGTVEEQTRLLRRRDGWVITHPESLVHAREGVLARPWDVIVFDEAQVIRNRKAQRTETAFELQSPYKVALTGHPFFNSPDELYAILRFLYPDEYTSFWRFFGMHVNADPKPFGGYDITGVRNKKLLRWEIAPFSLRRTKRQVFKHLPPITRMPRYAQLPPGTRREYEKLKKQFFVELEAHRGRTKILAIPSVLARVTRLRQYLIDPSLLGAKRSSVKYPIVREIMDELDGPPVIFTMFRQAALKLQAYLKGTTALIAGGMSRKSRRAVEKRFHAGTLDALIVVYQAGGVALNLGRYGYVIHLDLPWTAAELEQAEGRVDRPEEGTGTIVPTTAYRVIVEDTYEQRQEARLEHKHSMFSEVFTISQIKALFK